jgi:hypothetical protein
MSAADRGAVSVGAWPANGRVRDALPDARHRGAGCTDLVPCGRCGSPGHGMTPVPDDP